MTELVKIKEDGESRLYCWKCRTVVVEMDAKDSIYRLKCNECYKYRKEKYKLEWICTRENVLAGCQFCLDAYTFKKKSEVHKCPMVGVYQCRLCAYQLNSSKSLRVHLKVTHDMKKTCLRTGEKTFDCNICKKAFAHKGNLVVHFRTHTGEKPFECNICKKLFGQKVHLTVHLRTHTGEKPFECNICGKAFIARRYLQKHLRTHTGEKPFECTICKKAFGESSDLARHLKTHTGEKPFKCTICERGFCRSGDLTCHLKTHTGEKPFQCNVCVKTFSRSSNLSSHMRTHTGEKPFKCKICNQVQPGDDHATRWIF